MKLNKPILLILGAGLVANRLLAADAPRGNLIELHSCELYAGGCTVSSEAVQGGHYLLQVWDVRGGAWQGVDLTGLKAAVFSTSGDNLAEANTRADRTVVYLPQNAKPEQRDALLAWLKTCQSSLVGSQPQTRVVPVSVSTRGDIVTFKAGDFASLNVAPMAQCLTRSCGEDLWYEPRSVTTAFTVAANVGSTVREPALQLTWTDHDRRSVFLARFGGPSEAKSLFVRNEEWCGAQGRLL